MNAKNGIMYNVVNRLGQAVISLIIVFIAYLPIPAETFFSACRFHFGTDVGKVSNNAALMAQIDYCTSWAGSSEDFGMNSFFTTCKNNSKTPVVIAYIIAFTARRDLGLKDCNVGTPNLCQSGADYIRQHKPRILSQYVKYAQGAAQSFGTAVPMIWCMEPDYVQYGESTQNNGGLTATQAGAYMNEIIDTVKKYCPNAVFSIDISPWKDTSFYKTWYGAMNMKRFSFVNTSGGGSRPDQTFISDSWASTLPTWKWVFTTFGTPLIADADYGVGGGSTGYDTRWQNVTNLSARINDGVIAVSHYNPTSNYAADIVAIRSQIPSPPKCVFQTVQSAQFLQRQTNPLQEMDPPNGVVDIIDLSGKVVCEKNKSQIAGPWTRWNGDGMVKHPGTYVVRLRGMSMLMQKMIVINK